MTCSCMLQGGIKAVVWTDVLQASIMFVGIIAVTIIVSSMYMPCIPVTKHTPHAVLGKAS